MASIGKKIEGIGNTWDVISDTWEGIGKKIEGIGITRDVISDTWEGIGKKIEGIENTWDGILDTWDGIGEKIEGMGGSRQISADLSSFQTGTPQRRENRRAKTFRRYSLRLSKLCGVSPFWASGFRVWRPRRPGWKERRERRRLRAHGKVGELSAGCLTSFPDADGEEIEEADDGA